MIALQKLTVQDAYHLDLEPSLIVGPDEDFGEVIHRLARLSEARGLFVADAGGRLLGVITRKDLLDWARVKLGSVLQVPPENLDQAMRLASLIHASTAGQVLHPDSQRAGVQPGDSLAHALRLMIELDIIVLPVVDAECRIIGDLKLVEVLEKALDLADR